MTMNYPIDAIESCEGLYNPPAHHSVDSSECMLVSHFAQHNHGTNIDTQQLTNATVARTTCTQPLVKARHAQIVNQRILMRLFIGALICSAVVVCYMAAPVLAPLHF